MANEKRLIDANLLCDGCSFKTTSGECLMPCCKARTIPTVDAVEVVHGRWIHVPSSDMMTGKAYKCSECNKMRYGSFMPNYCQNCGAKMDGEAINEARSEA